MSSISEPTKTKKVNTSELMLAKMVEFNKDGSSNILTKWIRLQPTELDPEDSRLVNHSSSNQDCGCRELLLIIPTTMLTSQPESQRRTDNFGYTQNRPRLSTHSMRLSLVQRILSHSTITEAMLELSKQILDGTNSGPLHQLVTSIPINRKEPILKCTLLFNPRLTQK